MDITFSSDVDGLTKLLETARVRSYTERTKVLKRIAEDVAAKASATARSYPHATGTLADAVEVDGTPASKRIHADVREAFFLEYGSPSTGGPRPWLSAPARDGANQLLAELANIGELW